MTTCPLVALLANSPAAMRNAGGASTAFGTQFQTDMMLRPITPRTRVADRKKA